MLVLSSTGGSQCRLDESYVSIQDDSRPLFFEQVVRGQQASFVDTIETVIKDNETWTAYKTMLNVSTGGGAVDFDQMMVILAAIPAESGGYYVSFQSIEETDSTIVANYVLGVPGDDCITAMGLTVPYQAVTVRKGDLAVVFEREIEPLPCSFR